MPIVHRRTKEREMKRRRRDGSGTALVGWAGTATGIVAGAVGLLMLAGCSGGDESGSSPFAAAPTRATVGQAAGATTLPAAESAPATTAPASPRVTTRPPATTTPPTTEPAGPARPGSARVAVSPGQGPVGARISITGDGFTAEHWKQPGVPLWLTGSQAGCAFFAEASHTVHVSADGTLSGDFVVPASGYCRFSEGGDVAVALGGYEIAYQCTACTIGRFEVTGGGGGSGTQCGNVVFAPNSENMASDIVAYRLSCEEATALVRKIGPSLGPINGLPRAEADGFVCVRTSQSDRGLPTSTYECTRGSARVTFVRT
jgi:hypothetical protein